MVERPAFIEAGKGAMPLVFLHGVGSDSSCFAREVAHFGETRHAVAWDCPGYGASAFPARFDWATLAEAVAVLLDFLARDGGWLVMRKDRIAALAEFARARSREQLAERLLQPRHEVRGFDPTRWRTFEVALIR